METQSPTLTPTSSDTPATPDKPNANQFALSTIKRSERGLQLATFDEAVRFARAVVLSRLAPSAFDTPEKVFIAIQYGAEVGLSPMQSLQSIAVINGRPALWGDALPALVHASGKCEAIEERFEGDWGSEAFTAVCRVKRTGMPETVRTFSVADAKAAKLWGKAGPWQNYPKRMLQVRARAWAIRDSFADVLCGFGVIEEQQDIEGNEPAAERVVINNPQYRNLSGSLRDMAGCQNDNDKGGVVAWATDREFLSIKDIEGNEEACGKVLAKCKEFGWQNVLKEARASLIH